MGGEEGDAKFRNFGKIPALSSTWWAVLWIAAMQVLQIISHVAKLT